MAEDPCVLMHCSTSTHGCSTLVTQEVVDDPEGIGSSQDSTLSRCYTEVNPSTHPEGSALTGSIGSECLHGVEPAGSSEQGNAMPALLYQRLAGVLGTQFIYRRNDKAHSWPSQQFI